jgi:hypothetical protein
MSTRPNGPNEQETKAVIAAIEGFMLDLRSEKALYVQRCKPLHEAIKETIEDAVATKGFDKKALKITVKQRDFLRKMEALEAELDAVTQTALDRLQAQLGHFADSPLGRAAIETARKTIELKPRKKRDPIDELIDREDEPPAAAE